MVFGNGIRILFGNHSGYCNCPGDKGGDPLHALFTKGGVEMTTESIKKTSVPNVLCHFCGHAKPPYQTVIRGHLRLCRECLLKHQIDIVVMGTQGTDEPEAKE